MSRTYRKCLWIAIPFALFGAAALYYAVDPMQGGWLPRCLFHELTGWECPACGGQRTLHALLHGRVGDALRFNPFLLVSIPYLLAVAWTSFGRDRHAARLRPFVQHRAAVYAYCLLFVVWWVVRNL